MSAASVLLLVAFLVIIPILMLATLVAGEATSALASLSSENHWFGELMGSVQTWLSNLPVVGEYLSEKNVRFADIAGNIVGGSGALIFFLQALYVSVAGLVLWIFAMFFALFYFLIDGDRVVRLMKHVSPLSDRDDEELMRDFASMSRAVIRGSLAIALLQGVIGGIGVVCRGVLARHLGRGYGIFLAYSGGSVGYCLASDGAMALLFGGCVARDISACVRCGHCLDGG